MDLTHILRIVMLLAFFYFALRMCARIGGVTRDDFKRQDKDLDRPS